MCGSNFFKKEVDAILLGGIADAKDGPWGGIADAKDGPWGGIADAKDGAWGVIAGR